VRKKNYSDYNKVKKVFDLDDINELLEMGLNKEEIARELGIPQKYVKKLMEDYHDKC